jgi:ubiquinol-cytochrome c reductase cytochrome b subunit
MLVMALIIVHLLLLHEYVSSSPVGVANRNMFSSWYNKDAISVLSSLVICLGIMGLAPFLFMDADNWFHANPIATPEHIKPEWYFLFAYCILRSIPNKLFGVVALVASLLILIYFGVTNSITLLPGVVLLLTWLRGSEVSDVTTFARQLLSIIYFTSA